MRTPSPTGDESPNSSELDALRFFQTRTIARLSGYFPSDMWNRYVLQLSLLEPSIYYATSALGRLHRWYAYEEEEEPASSLGSPNPDAFIFRQYNKAIHHLVHPTTRPPSKCVVLVACYVLSSVEALYGDYRSSFQHVSNGIRLLCEHDSTTTSTTSHSRTYPPPPPPPPPTYRSTGSLRHSSEETAIEESLLIHFSHLDLQASTFHPEWVPSMQRQDPSGLSPVDDDLTDSITISISSLEEARTLLTSALLRVMAYKRHGEKILAKNQQTADHVDIVDVRSRLGRYLRQWSNAVETWLAAQQTKSEPESEGSPGVLCLRILHLTACIILAVPRSADEIMYDSLLDQFQRIVDLASALVSLQQKKNDDDDHGDDHPRHHMEYSHEVGIIPALYLTGTKCRDPTIRRRALSLLTSCRRKEGVWDSRAAAKIVSRVIALEEKEEEGDGRPAAAVHTCADVPEESRLRDTWLQAPSNADRHAPLVHTRRRAARRDDVQLEVIVDHIQW